MISDKDYAHKGFVRHGVVLMPQEVALEFLQACKEQEVELLGFDAFKLVSESQIQPVLEYCLDVSSRQYESLTRQEKYALAEKVLGASAASSLVFEFVLD